MAEIEMTQKCSINALLVTLAGQFPTAAKVTVTNVGGLRITGDQVELLAKPTETKVDLKELRAKRPDLPAPRELLRSADLVKTKRSAKNA